MRQTKNNTVFVLILMALFMLTSETIFSQEDQYAYGEIASGSTLLSEVTDTDADGIADDEDTCPQHPNGPGKGTCMEGQNKGDTCNSNNDCGGNGLCVLVQDDTDGDGFGDVCDYCMGGGAYDFDLDGICDEDDNCFDVYNPDQEENDGDGYGNVCTDRVPKSYSYEGPFAGSYEEIGRQVAHTYADQIVSYAYTFMGIFSPEIAQSYYDDIEHMIPESIKAHMEGAAFGLTEVRPISYDTAWDMITTSGLFFNLISSLSASSRVTDTEEILGCTAFAFSSEAGTFLGHNTDNPMSDNASAILHYVPDNGDNSYIHFFHPGFVDLSLGMNDKGIAITFNTGNPNVNAAVGLPVLFMARYALEKASTVDEVVGYFQDFIDTPGNSFGYQGGILLVVDVHTGSMAKIQVRSEKIKVTYDEELKPGVMYIASTNHYDEDFRDDPTYYYESSWKRRERLEELLSQFETYNLDICWAILTDHGDGEPDNNTISRDGPVGDTVITNVFTADKAYYTVMMPHVYLDIYGEPQVFDFERAEAVCAMEQIYGGENEKLKILRDFRDNVLSRSLEGREIIKHYYKTWSPFLVRLMESNQLVKEIIKSSVEGILPLIKARLH